MTVTTSPSRGWRDLWARAAQWFETDSTWERVPKDPARIARTDLVVALVFTALAMVAIELMRSMDAPLPDQVWLPHVLVAVGILPLAFRRRYPLVVAALLALHMLVVGLTVPVVMGSMPMQIAYFLAILTGVGWARDRRAMMIVTGSVLIVMAVWLAWQFAVSNDVQQYLTSTGKAPVDVGLFSPVAAYTIYTVLINIVYFGGAVIGGQFSWRAAKDRDLLAQHTATISQQAEDLRQQAVLAERLRIARELHDVVAHHVSVIGIQAAGARKVLTRDPVAAEVALRAVESSSRDAVTQMRALLGTLRDSSGTSDGDRAPEPHLRDVESLVASSTTPGLTVTCTVVEDVPGAIAAVPGPVGLSLYRTVQESLANVRRHSTAKNATVTVRVEHRSAPGFPMGFAEVEVVDDGRPRHGTSGTGLGLLGIRERLAVHGGVSEIGPRLVGGYRVRVRMPLTSDPAPARSRPGGATSLSPAEANG